MWMEGWGDLPGHLVVISGPSGSGKSTLVRRILESNDIHATLSVSATTRAPRPGEEHGKNYFFVGHDEFLGMRDRGELFEFAEFAGNCYGTPIRPVIETLRKGGCVILEIEVQGALQVREHAPSALYIFIDVPRFWELEKRLRNRGTEDDAAIHRRLVRARWERDHAHCYDTILINDDLDQTATRLINLLVQHGCGGKASDA
ncbi:MAG: guanylate kinase [Planctomycetota bacterium]|nr:guanylate kinase [Planctomycetota bacterium]